MARPGVSFALPSPSTAPTLRLDAPATEVMTDLRRVGAVTIAPDASIDEANQAMIAHGVRALFALDEHRRVLGLVTATDLLGERPIQFAQAREIRRSEVVVRDIMTPADRLEVLDLREVERARVGDMVASLRLAGRQHALAVEATEAPAPGQVIVRGIFSLTQIARRLGVATQPTHDIARTFAEVEAAIGGD
jgi:CBS domain-containing protein